MSQPNPYLPPAHQESPAELQFYCRPGYRLLLRLMMWGKVKPAEFLEPTNEYQMRSPLWVRWTGRLLMIFNLAGLVISQVQQPGDLFWSVVTLGGIALGAFAHFACEYVCWSDEHVRRAGPFWFRQSLRWDEVTAVNVVANGDLVLSSGDQRKVVVKNDLHGQLDLLRTIRDRLPAAVIVEAELAELEKLYR